VSRAVDTLTRSSLETLLNALLRQSPQITEPHRPARRYNFLAFRLLKQGFEPWVIAARQGMVEQVGEARNVSPHRLLKGWHGLFVLTL
jgi:hypothetical protein